MTHQGSTVWPITTAEYDLSHTFMSTDSDSFSLFTIFTATFFPEMQWTPIFTKPARRCKDLCPSCLYPSIWACNGIWCKIRVRNSYWDNRKLTGRVHNPFLSKIETTKLLITGCTTTQPKHSYKDGDHPKGHSQKATAFGVLSGHVVIESPSTGCHSLDDSLTQTA